ncbi:MAG: MarR family transcriptional regulator [Pirellulales bacterium]
MEHESRTGEHPLSEGVRPIDQAVLDLLRRSGGLTVQELIDRLEVTATAVRQRLDRLVQVELIERRKVVAGRGRPQFRYFLTSLGMRYASASYAGLALALWQEVTELPNPMLRQRILRKVARRMGNELRSRVPQSGSLEERISAVAGALAQQKVPTAVDGDHGLPVLQVHACPYPELSQHEGQRALCELEQEMISEAVGEPMELECCRLDGHGICQFRPASDRTAVQPVLHAIEPVPMEHNGN